MRHEYWRIDPDIVWNVVNDDLPPLRVAVEICSGAPTNDVPSPPER